MEGDSVTPAAGLEWENLALYTANAKPLHFSMSDLYHVSSASEEMMGMPDPVVGLRLGRHKEYGGGEAFASPSSASSIPISSMPTKRSRASYHNMQNPCCQVEGCNLDLKLAKDYHRRHRICETHSKSPKVIVAGMERRFCQQCSRFHDLSEFDDKKRSCRRRLSDHNARRRRVQPESIHLNSSSGISPALYTDQRQQNVLLNGLPVSLPNSSWENSNTAMPRHAFVRPPKGRGLLEGTLNGDDVLSSIHRSTPRMLDQCLHHHVASGSNSSMAPDLLSAHSLLSSNSWSLNEGESSTSIEGIVQGNYSPVMRHSEPDSHHLSLFQTNNVGGLEQGLNMHNAASSHHHLFKPPYHSGTFYSTQRTL